MAIGSSFHPGVFLDCSLIYSFVVGSHFRVKISEQIASAAQLAGAARGCRSRRSVCVCSWHGGGSAQGLAAAALEQRP